ncbi:hypothetical protein RKD46_007651 [Streptomyces pseudovenezuelae]
MARPEGPDRFVGVGDERPVGRPGRSGHTQPHRPCAGTAGERGRRRTPARRPGRGPGGGPLARRQATASPGPPGAARQAGAEDRRDMPGASRPGHGRGRLVVLPAPQRQHQQRRARRQGRYGEGRRLRPDPDQHPGHGLGRPYQQGGLQTGRRLLPDRSAERERQRGRADGGAHLRGPLQRHRHEHPPRHHGRRPGLQGQRERRVHARLLRPDQQRAAVRPRLPGRHHPPAHRHPHRPLRQARLLRCGEDVRRGRRCLRVRRQQRVRHLLAPETVQGRPHPQG